MTLTEPGVATLERVLRSMLDGEHTSMTISFNDHHACNYVDVAGAIEAGMYDDAEWISDEARVRAIETDSVWEIQWYPDTPVGFYSVLASTLLEAITAAVRMGGGRPVFDSVSEGTRR